MRVMFVISVTALVALLWATFSIARFVRRVRRKQRAVRHTFFPAGTVAVPPPPMDLPEASASLPHAEHGRS